MVWKYRFRKDRCIKQIDDIQEWQKLTAEFGKKGDQWLLHGGGKRWR